MGSEEEGATEGECVKRYATDDLMLAFTLGILTGWSATPVNHAPFHLAFWAVVSGIVYGGGNTLVKMFFSRGKADS